MPTLDDIYGGILKPGPKGGLFEPGPEVVFPSQSSGNVVRVTPEGLNVYQRPVVAIDSAGNPIIAAPQPVMRAPSSGSQRTAGGMAGTVQLPAGVRPEAVDRAFEEIDRQRAAENAPPAPPPKVNDLGFYPAKPLPAPQVAAGTPRLPKGSDLALRDVSGWWQKGAPALQAIETAAPVMVAATRMPLNKPLALMGPSDPMFAHSAGATSSGTPVMRAAATTYSDQSSASSQGGGSGYSAPSVSYGTPVMLASGTASTVGAMGTAQGGRYVYQVQSDGSVKNLTTGRTTAPATR